MSIKRDEILKDIINNLRKHRGLAVIAPTGFGKSSLFINYLNETLNEWKRILHVLPLRSIITDLLTKLWHKSYSIGIDPNAIIGYQAGIDISIRYNGKIIEIPKDPYLLSRYVVTTYDSYSLSLLVSPIPDLSKTYCHGDVSYLALTSALNVFDEIHILAKSDELVGESPRESVTKSISFIKALSRYLNSIDIPSVYMTATLPTIIMNILFENKEPLYVILGKEGYKVIKNKVSIKRYVNIKNIDELSIEAQEYINKLRTRISTDDIVNDVLRLIKIYDKVLVIVNTVSRAIDVYLKLRNRVDSDIVLIHSRYTLRDKATKLSEIIEKLHKHKKFITISTQVLEAGVDVSFDALVTDIAPPEALIQRVGRVLRSLKHIASVDKGEVIINVSENAIKNSKIIYPENIIDKTINMLRHINMDSRFDWRFAIIKPNFIELLESVYNQIPENLLHNIDVNSRIIENYLESTPIANLVLGKEKVWESLSMIEDLFKGSIIRDSVLIPLAININGSYDLIDVSADMLLSRIRKWLGNKPIVVIEITSDNDTKYYEIPITKFISNPFAELRKRPLTTIARINRFIRHKISFKEIMVKFFGFKLLRDAYNSEVGLL